MSDTYTKLFSSITESTIWCEPAGTRLLWITFLAKCNRHGEVFGSVPGMARLANITLEECELGLSALMAPDPYSRTSANEGRRIEIIDGGWRILNHAKFDRIRSEAEAEERARERKREWDRQHRPSGHARAQQSDGSPTQSDESPTQSVPPPTPAVTPEDQDLSSLRSDLSSASPTDLLGAVPPADLKAKKAQRIMQIATEAQEAYNRILAKPTGLLSACLVLNKDRLKAVESALPTARQICRRQYGSERVTPEFWQALFETAAEDGFCSGKGPYRPPHENWRPDIEYLLREDVIAKLFERAMSEAAA